MYNAISFKISTMCFVDVNKLILIFICKDKRTRIAKAILKKKKTKKKRIKWYGSLPNFKVYYMATAIRQSGANKTIHTETNRAEYKK